MDPAIRADRAVRLMETYKSIQGDTVDLICWRTYGSQDGFVERVLDANPGLSALGPVLPIGTAVKLPDIQKPAALPNLSLWD